MAANSETSGELSCLKVRLVNSSHERSHWAKFLLIQQTQFRKGRALGASLEGIHAVSPSQQPWLGSPDMRVVVMLCSQSKHTDGCWYSMYFLPFPFLLFPILLLKSHSSLGMVPLLFRWIFPSQVNHWNVLTVKPRGVSQVIPSPFKLTMKMKCHNHFTQHITGKQTARLRMKTQAKGVEQALSKTASWSLL